ncbi:MAG: hypothetical protein JJ879_12275 [Sneathiella sp.]|nr:hypothetical protein [Sneathiella sp.]
MRWFLIVAGFLVLLLAGAAGGSVYALQKFHGEFLNTAQTNLEKASGLPILLKDISTGGITGDATIGEVSLLGTRADHKPLVTFSGVNVKVDPKSFLSGILIVDHITAEAVSINVEGTNYGLKDIATSLSAARGNVNASAEGPVVIIKSVSLPAGKFTVGGQVFGRPVQASHQFNGLRLAALGENSGGERLPKLLQQILTRFMLNALGARDLKAILR